MSKISKEITVKNPHGLHMRPATMFAQIASKYNSRVTVQKGNIKVDGKSVIEILTLGVRAGVKIILEIDGEDAQKLFIEVEELLTKVEKRHFFDQP